MIRNDKKLTLDHIGVAVSDVEATVKWYQDILGFEIFGKFLGKSGNYTYFLRNGAAVYEMYQSANLEPAAIGKIDHIAYVSDDIEADYAYCVEQGYEICTNGIEFIKERWGNGCRYFKILSPSKEQVEFAQILY